MQLFLFGSLLIGFFDVQAQTSTRFAVKLGLNSSIQSIELPPSERRTLPFEFHRRIGLEGAFGVEYFASSSLSIVTQIEYSQRGTGEIRKYASPYSYPYISSPLTYHRIDYISIPLIFRVTLTSRKPHPSLFVGPKIDFPIGYQNVLDNILMGVYNNLKRPSYELVLGIGIELFPATIIECRYDFDLGNTYYIDDYIVKSNTINISLGYLF